MICLSFLEMSFSELAKIDIFLAGSKLAALSFLTTSDVFPRCCCLVPISYFGYTGVYESFKGGILSIWSKNV